MGFKKVDNRIIYNSKKAITCLYYSKDATKIGLF